MTIRELLPDEFSNIPPEALGGYAFPSDGKVVAAIEEGEIVGVWCLLAVAHVEPLWIASHLRNSVKGARLIHALWEKLRDVGRSLGLTKAVSVVPEGVTEHIATSLGAVPLPGALYLVSFD